MSYEISKYEIEKLESNAFIQPGFAFKSERFTDNDDDTPLVKGENVHQGYIDWLGARRWPRSEYEAFDKYHLNAGDIVLAMDRPWVTAGLKWSYIKPHDPDSLLVQRVARIRAKGRLDQTYLRHVISSSYFANYLQPIVTGVNVPHISGKQVGAFRIPIPDPITQRKIAAILTAYDDLIENNKRRVTLLEKMAEEFYREWFVRMRFPGHQNTKFVKGVPEGWEAIRIGDRVTTQYGYTESANDNPVDPKFLRITDIVPRQIDWDAVPHCPIDDSDEKKYRLHEGDIVVARTGATVGYAKRINKIAFRAVFASYLVRMVPINPADSLYFGLAVESRAFKDFIQGYVTGAAQPQANATTMSLFSLYSPGEKLLAQFNGLIQPLLDQKDQLILQSRNLTKTRDLLLPRLISGKISVENLDIQFPPSMRADGA